MASINAAVSGRATNATADVPGTRDAATSHAAAPDVAVVLLPAVAALTMLRVEASERTVARCTATTPPSACSTPRMSSVPITDAPPTGVAGTAAGTVTWPAASCRPTPAMKVASDARWPSMRLEAIDTLSAALFSAWLRVLAAASISGTTAMVRPAPGITPRNLRENDAPRQMPLNHRAPRIDCRSARSSNQDEGQNRDRRGHQDR